MGMKQMGFSVGGSSSASAVSPANQSLAEFESLAIPLLNSVFNLARWLTRNDHDAEDLVQDTYLKAYRSFHSFEPGTNFQAWIYKILRNTFLTSRTGPRAAHTVSLDSDECGTDLAIERENPETILATHMDLRLLERAIEDLPVHYREPLLLCDIEEMSYRQIAEILAIPIGTVMSRLARARKLVRESLLKPPSAPRSYTC